MLKIENLHKKYKKFPVLKGLYMNLEKGDVYGFLGKNGCGKTTTMNIICNIIAKDEGKIIFNSEENDNPGSPQALRIGYLTETPALYGFMNSYEYLEYIAGCAGYTGDVRSRINEVLSFVGMTDGGLRRIKGYSRGMTQRLGIAAAIFNHPQLLILDEPTSALDPEGRAEIMGVIQTLKESGTTIILCTHIITDVERVANKIGIMKNGIIEEEGSIDEIMAKYKGGNSQITINLSEPNLETAALFRGLPSVTMSDYNMKNGRITLDSANPDELYNQVITLIAENKIRISELSAQKTTLEDVYFTITGLKGLAPKGGRA